MCIEYIHFFLVHHQFLLESNVQIENLSNRKKISAQYIYHQNKEKVDLYLKNIIPI